MLPNLSGWASPSAQYIKVLAMRIVKAASEKASISSSLRDRMAVAKSPQALEKRPSLARRRIRKKRTKRKARVAPPATANKAGRIDRRSMTADSDVMNLRRGQRLPAKAGLMSATH